MLWRTADVQVRVAIVRGMLCEAWSWFPVLDCAAAENTESRGQAMSIKRITRNITRPAVLAALSEYDAIGQPAFLKKYGYKPARTYKLWHEGKPYDSKVIVGQRSDFRQSAAPAL